MLQLMYSSRHKYKKKYYIDINKKAKKSSLIPYNHSCVGWC